jgi:DNA-binding HxlR family transcriptional regulator
MQAPTTYTPLMTSRSRARHERPTRPQASEAHGASEARGAPGAADAPGIADAPAGGARPAIADAPGVAESTRPPSGLATALDRVGDRWSLLVVEALLDGPRRFGELETALTGIAPNILSDRLRRLERDGIIRSTPYSTRPTRLAYALTADGGELAGALRLLADWGSRTVDRPEALRHETCGTPLEARWYCPTCARALDGVEPDGLTRL